MMTSSSRDGTLEPGAAAPAAAGLEVSGLHLRFGGVRVLDGVSMRAEPGRVHAVIGPNGAGKSSLLNSVSGLYRPQGGRIRLDRGDRVLDLTGRPAHRIAGYGVGRAFQNGSLFGSLTVEENLLVGRHHRLRGGVLTGGLALRRGRSGDTRARRAVREVADRMEIAHLLGRPAAELAFGDAKRVDVARALCGEPSLLLLDEPAAGVPGDERLRLGRTIRQICDEWGLTVLLVEHDMALVMEVSDRITVLSFGREIATGTPAEVTADDAVIEAYLGRPSSTPGQLRPRKEHA